MPWVCLQFVTVVSPDHTHLLYLVKNLKLLLASVVFTHTQNVHSKCIINVNYFIIILLNHLKFLPRHAESCS